MMLTAHVSASRGYDILIGGGLLDEAGERLSRLKASCTAVIISDDIVAGLYIEKAAKSLENAGYRVLKYIFPHSEASKNIFVLSDILEFLAREHITASDLLVALGGGVTGDITGFAASVYLRGVEFMQLPTSLLAMVDSSVGGKTAVNLSAGKNLAGSFYQPIAVFCDTDCLETLPPKYFSDGMAEVIKYGMICSPPLLDILENDGMAGGAGEIIRHCVSIKADIVEHDEFDRGERRLLNFGHTIGHAIEKLSGFTVSHGFGVAAGMAYMSRIGLETGFCTEDFTERLDMLLRKYSLTGECPYSARDLYGAALGDKKRRGKSIALVIPEKWGKCGINTVGIEEFGRMLGIND